MTDASGAWKLLSRIAAFHTPWIQLIGERWEAAHGDLLTYWRTVVPDSVIVIAEQDGSLLLPRKMFRPGVGRATLDFPGGRLRAGTDPENAAREILARELGVQDTAIAKLKPVISKPLVVNSSTSNQMLYGFHAILTGVVEGLLPHTRFSLDSPGLETLLGGLDCLQCRCVLLDYLRQERQSTQ